ncbi:HAD-superfamily hydrolase, subfamily IA, variant 3 protein family [Shewanella benthica KT99]|uniref:HAD-superfamily hydrolase, subfamily IA, variant 3 protein family n=1 Tax=Shewanella benthica KT99 TaxID=314608 RepID=A9DCV8_9GAMM|nr:HAD-superfamily hydrolase, subfamily IA, variant 3 protein family [Shewanella benthica KT99]
MTGVESALEYCRANDYKIGLATSSSSPIIEAVLNKLNIAHYFDAIQSAEHLSYGKPHPEVYLNCAKILGLEPMTCVAIEDSFNGLVAARAATIPAVAQQDEPKWIIAHQQLKDLTELEGYLAKTCY